MNPGDKWVVGHKIPQWERPDLIWVSANWQHEHASCSASTGQHEVMRKAYEAGRNGENWPGFSRNGRLDNPRSFQSLSHGVEAEPEQDATDWNDLCGSIEWMAEFREVPQDGVAPRFMTGPHPRATGTYGPDFCAWADDNPGLHAKRTGGLRWWQRAVAYRMLEHDAEGELVWRNVLVTMARQCGKSWLLRALLMWRIQQRDLFGDEDQTVLSVAHKAQTAHEIMRPASRWAMERKDLGWLVRLASGDIRVESPDGGRWLLAAANDGMGVGYSLSMIVVDEAWKVHRSVVEAADPALTEAVSPQLMLISTAGDSASDLFMTYRQQALDTLLEPESTFIAEWSAPKSMEPGDPESWRMASPFWSTRRFKEIADKVEKLDPLEFKQNYCNQWVSMAGGRNNNPGEPVFGENEWIDASAPTPTGTPAACAVESWFGEGLSVALAYLQDDGGVVVAVTSFMTANEAAAHIKQAGAPSVLCGKSLALDPAFAQIPLTPKGGTSKVAVQDLRRLLDEGVFLHDGSESLAEQALAARAVPSADGIRIRSSARLDAVKAAVWACAAARAAQEPSAIY
ncbi:hypothetical protein [Nocardioides antri]|uniref:Terminase n=1 Tax=Nocardioides antri TaxID=2607659 RepID=A0A5B1LY38_9ACTN|nr:hypothetical protein [Nocardioides antri]KAA1424320.1 hypothetical protein F0U47_18985 [Nocardioides antri]